MKKFYLSAALLATLGAGNMAAQDIYTVEQMSANDLNGDARFIGMGGAMGALGANISAMSNNPAGIGLYRRGDFAITGSLLGEPSNSANASYLGTSRVKASLDQLGFVYAMNIGDRSLKFVNIGFNYRKARNFKNLAAFNNIPLADGRSQGWQLRGLAYTDSQGWLDLSKDDDRMRTTPLANLAYDTFVLDPAVDGNKKISDYKHSYAEAYHYGRAQWGDRQEFDFNIGFNFSEQYYLGVNIGAYNISGSTRMEYEEASLGEDGQPFYTTNGQRKTYLQQVSTDFSGTGVDAKFGFIARPFAEKPFRLGIAVSTPTYYAISSSSTLNLSSPYEHTDKQGNHFDYTESSVNSFNEYRLRTPWKANFSVATTFGGKVAVGAEYEIADHTSAQVRYLDDFNYDYAMIGAGTVDRSMQDMIDSYLRDTHTLRLGIEASLAPKWLARVGYNYVSSPISKKALLNLFTTSPSYNYATGTDYVNLGETNRLTLGLGYRTSSFYADVAYQYQTQSATLYPFALQGSDALQRATDYNDVQGQDFSLNRHQFSLTIGCRF